MTSKEKSEAIELDLLNGTELNAQSIVFLPLGSHEFHGVHAPLGTDAIIASTLAKSVALQVPNSFVLPVLNYSYSVLHEAYPGTVSVSAQTVISLLEDILCSLAKKNLQRVVIINGHDGNVPCIDIAATNVRHKYPSCKIVATTWWEISKQSQEVRNLFGKYGGKGHGGAEEVALVLASGRGQIHLQDAEDAEILSITSRTAAPFLRHDLTLIFQDMAEITGKPYEGIPTEGTLEKGKFILEYLVTEIVAFIKALDWN